MERHKLLFFIGDLRKIIWSQERISFRLFFY